MKIKKLNRSKLNDMINNFDQENSINVIKFYSDSCPMCINLRDYYVDISQKFKNDSFSIFLNGEDVTSKIRGHKVSVSVSEYAKKPEIRNFVYNLLRKSSKLNSIVVDGRDIGTVVFPDADYKFFLYAIPEIRAQRRHKEINDETVKIESIEREIKERDDIDSTREIAPLKKAEDAYGIDVSYLAIDQVFEEILEKITF